MTKKVLKILIIALFIAGACILARFLFGVISKAGHEESALAGALVLSAFALLLVMCAAAGVLALTGRPVKGMAIATALVALASAAIIAAGVSNAAGRDPVETPEQTRRPIVTAPPVVIEPKEKVNHNPETGEVFTRKYGDQSAKLTVVNNSSSQDYFVRLREISTGDTAFSFYVRAGESVTLGAPKGSYDLLFASGRTWQDEETLFGSRTILERATETLRMPYGSAIEFQISGDDGDAMAGIRSYEW